MYDWFSRLQDIQVVVVEGDEEEAEAVAMDEASEQMKLISLKMIQICLTRHMPCLMMRKLNPQNSKKMHYKAKIQR